ncbi:hypothetical protein [Helicobacter sp. 11S02629-2]|uniref:hypothetical protein n=1 Tax=Helicobacter sp. 11S02629-2 TaxID=1476195 RepID=UPI000BA7C6AB|nr:hypothetical protein [Helicobacter sp. 11S02629-2]PAF44902.1 hypothetical protein BKH40_04230 [Helicobacter sp. 11S02629-2]
MNKLGDFYNFNNLKSIYKDIDSKEDFIQKYIYKLAIKVHSKQDTTKTKYLFKIVGFVLESFANNAFKLLESYKVNEWSLKPLRLLKNKVVLQGKKSNIVVSEQWFVFKNFIGTKLECELVDFIKEKSTDINRVYETWYLVRNERNNFMAIYDESARRFEPDFYFFGKKHGEKSFKILQCFLEPKGAHLIEHDKWKNEFLEVINIESKEIDTDESLHRQEDKSVKLKAVPFFENKDSKTWEEGFLNTLL